MTGTAGSAGASGGIAGDASGADSGAGGTAGLDGSASGGANDASSSSGGTAGSGGVISSDAALGGGGAADSGGTLNTGGAITVTDGGSTTLIVDVTDPAQTVRSGVAQIGPASWIRPTAIATSRELRTSRISSRSHQPRASWCRSRFASTVRWDNRETGSLSSGKTIPGRPLRNRGIRGLRRLHGGVRGSQRLLRDPIAHGRSVDAVRVTLEGTPSALKSPWGGLTIHRDCATGGDFQGKGHSGHASTDEAAATRYLVCMSDSLTGHDLWPLVLKLPHDDWSQTAERLAAYLERRTRWDS